MPDLSIEYFYHCKTTEEFAMEVPSSTTSQKYIVTYGKIPQYLRHKFQSEYGWQCQCIGFQTRGKCGHIEKAKDKCCGWDQHLHGGHLHFSTLSGEKIPVCPSCGGPVAIHKVAV